MKNKHHVILLLLYCTLYLGVNTNGYCNPISDSNSSAYSVEFKQVKQVSDQVAKPYTSETSFGGIALLLGLLALYGVKKLADATFNNIDQTD